jgi:hypothetical protein
MKPKKRPFAKRLIRNFSRTYPTAFNPATQQYQQQLLYRDRKIRGVAAATIGGNGSDNQIAMKAASTGR